MEIITESFSFQSEGLTSIIDITNEVEKLLRKSGMREGSALIFAPGATAGITTIEYEPGLMQDYPAFFEQIIPSNKTYAHDDTWHDGNGYSHVRASLQGASFTVPFSDSQLLLGTWQQIIFIDFDNRPRSRKVIVQFTGK
ncbi:MAG: hypothetical protein SCALA702_25430 [Melioribacteraceae bacterium]|nr:MAG: hypothetical protein SCALA702_25430 [Melioribacteraceae bacterium]